MPRNGAQVFSKPANTTAVSGQTIESAKYNQTIDDIVDDLNLDRPVEAGGTGASNATDARANLTAATRRTRSAKAANYTAQATDDGAWFEATAAITLSFAAAATLGNRWECLVFANGGDVTLDPNGAETINGAATLVIEDGGAALVHCTGATLHAVTMHAPIESADVTGALGYTPVTNARTVSGAGLATGGGDLTTNRTITVTAASQAEAEAGTDNTKAMTPLRTQQAMAGISATGIGTYSLMRCTAVGSFGPGDTTAGTNLEFSNARGSSLGAPAGTWLCTGTCSGGFEDDRSVTTWRRIS